VSALLETATVMMEEITGLIATQLVWLAQGLSVGMSTENLIKQVLHHFQIPFILVNSWLPFTMPLGLILRRLSTITSTSPGSWLFA
jgi:hypothetical protein